MGHQLMGKAEAKLAKLAEVAKVAKATLAKLAKLATLQQSQPQNQSLRLLELLTTQAARPLRKDKSIALQTYLMVIYRSLLCAFDGSQENLMGYGVIM